MLLQQIALFVVPYGTKYFIPKVETNRFFPQRFIVTLAWMMGKPLTLLFDPYESVALFLSGTWLLSRLCIVMTLTNILFQLWLSTMWCKMGNQIGWKASFSCVCFSYRMYTPNDWCNLGLYLILAVTFWYYPGSGMLAKLFVPVWYSLMTHGLF
jgi:hypothetical protein